MQPDDLPLCLYFEYGNVVGVLLSAVSFFTIWLRAAESAVFVRFFFFSDWKIWVEKDDLSVSGSLSPVNRQASGDPAVQGSLSPFLGV